MRTSINKKGFTIIELVVVIAVIAIITLLAAGRMTGYAKRAKITHIKNDIKAAENIIDEHLAIDQVLPENWNDVSLAKLNNSAAMKDLYSTKGLVDKVEVDEYKEIDKSTLIKKVKTTLPGVFYTSKGGKVYYESKGKSTPPKNIFKEKVKVKENSVSRLIVLDTNFPNGIFKAGEIISGDIKVKGVRALDFNLQVNMVHRKTGATINIPMDFSLDVDEEKTLEFNYTVLPEDVVGFYDTNMTLRQGERELQVHSMSRNVYIVGEGWEYFLEEDMRGASADAIGRIGALSPDKLSYKYVNNEIKNIEYSNIDVAIDPNDNVTGQAYTHLPITYGTYEAKIKVPDSKALLSSFFLFGYVNEDDKITPYEIDMEVLYYEGKWQLWTTVFNESNKVYKPGEYSEKGTVFHKEIDLDFDPSKDYHNYKIDFYDKYVSFSLDDKVVAKWDGAFDYGEMRAYTGTFYTHWLTKEISSVPLKMEVEWIRRGYFQK